ncbi:MAG: hypothetical protein NTU88_11870, partial [Armatimonadetes bacterium]|nr:hypothetical protein [Armatimonadota bacterium]
GSGECGVWEYGRVGVWESGSAEWGVWEYGRGGEWECGVLESGRVGVRTAEYGRVGVWECGSAEWGIGKGGTFKVQGSKFKVSGIGCLNLES